MSIAYGGIIAFIFRGLNVLVAFALVVVTSNELGASGRGAFVLGLTVIGIVNAVTGGLTAAAGRQIANQRREPGDVLLSGGSLAIILGMLAVACGAVGGAVVTGDASQEILPVGVAAAAVIVNGLVAGVFLGQGAFVRYNLCLLLPPLLSLTAIVAELGLLDHETATTALWGYAGGQWVALPLLLASGAGRSLGRAQLDRRLARGMATFALVAGLSSGLSFLNYRADQFVVEHFEGTAGLAVYANAVLIAESVWQFSGSLATATVARIGALPRGEAVELTTRIMRHTLVILLAVCGTLFVAADLIVGLFFDKEFSGMAAALRILLPGVLLYGLAPAFSGFYTYQVGRPSASAIVAGAGLIIDIGLDFVLVPLLGVNGAALASAIAYAAAILGALSVFLWETHTRPMQVLRFGRADVDDYRQLIARLKKLALRHGRGLAAGGTQPP